jgi:hypothetical protein
MSSCTIDSGPRESIDAITAIDLPWLTELIVDEPNLLDLVLNGENGLPGYLLECATVLGLMDDACTGEHATTTVTNGTEDVDISFSIPTAEEELGCIQGNSKSGVIDGEFLVLTESGLSLAVS